jgi:hypothetical protein
VMKTDPSANPKVRPEVAATLSARIDAETSRGSAYCAFKRDRERLLALVSRDLRLVLITVVVALTLPSSSGLLSSALALLSRGH